jgi:hypothetical protein
LHVGEGDEVEFAVHDDGTVTIRGYVSIPTDQAWFLTPEWLGVAAHLGIRDDMG